MKGNDQQEAWEREYRIQKLLSPSNVPQADVLRFMRWLNKRYRAQVRAAGGGPDSEPFSMEGTSVLDLGSGTGRNAYAFAERGAVVTGIEFSETAIRIAKAAANAGGLPITYLRGSIGTTFPVEDASIDIMLDVTSSNSLSDAEREVYVRELVRTLKPGGMLFLRALSRETDANAKELIKRFPGGDPDTYVHPDLGIVEKVFSRESLMTTYGPPFDCSKLERTEHYATISGRKYKRQYWVAYFQKRAD